MAKALISPPAALPVTLAEAKAHLRVETDDEDDYIAGLLATATAHVEAATGKSLISQVWRIYLDRLPDAEPFELPVAPLLSVDAIAVYDAEGNPAAADLTLVDVDRHSDPPRLLVRGGVEAGAAFNGVEIDVTAGFGEAGPDVPGQLRRAILVLAANWHAFRGQASGEALYGSVPRGFDTLIAPFRRARL